MTHDITATGGNPNSDMLTLAMAAVINAEIDLGNPVQVEDSFILSIHDELPMYPFTPGTYAYILMPDNNSSIPGATRTDYYLLADVLPYMDDRRSWQ